MRRTPIILCLALLALVSPTFAQTGFPAFGSFHSTGFDAVNQQNLNAISAIPIMSTPGRGQSFQYSLVNNSLLWTKTTVGSTTTWSSVTDASGNPTWGWNYGPAVSSSGQLLVPQISTHLCRYIDPDTGLSSYYPWTSYSGFKYKDWLGTIHSFNVAYVVASAGATTFCGIATTTGSGYSTDGTGFYLLASQSSTYVLSSSGIGGGVTPLDTNGNFVGLTVVNSTQSNWIDTAGHVALEVFNNGSNIQYKWQDSTGGYTSATTTTMQLSTLNIKTNFACAGVGEYTGTASLPTEIDLPNGQKYLITYEPTPGNSGYYTGRVKRVTFPTGGYYEYQYPTTAGDGIVCADATVNSLIRIMNDGTNSSTWTFSRVPGSPNSVTTVTAPVLPYDSGVANNSVYTFNASGQQITAQIYQGAATLKRTISTTWTNGAPATQITTLEDNQTKNEVDTTFDSYGNLLSLKEHGWGTGTPGSIVRTTTFTYLNTSPYISANILNRVTRVTVADSGSVTRSRTDVAYDESGYINYGTCHTGVPQHSDTSGGCSVTVRGNPTTVTTYTNAAAGTGATTHHSYYDNLGNLVKADLDCCQSKTWLYSATTNYSFPDSATRGSSPGTQLTTSAAYNPYTGLVTTSNDENSQQTTYGFDNLKRIISVQLPDTNHTTRTWTYTDATPPTQSSVAAGVPIQGSNVQNTVTTVDGLGRPVTQKITDGTATYSIVATQYDPLGRPYMSSNPYTSTAQYWTTAQFDTLGRATKTILPDNSQTTFSYAASSSVVTATVTDPAGKARKSQVDGLGRMTSVFEPDVANSNALTQQTSYAYNVLDLLTGVTQGSQTRTYVYDDLGRVTKTTTPEAGTVCFGSVSGSTCNTDGYDSFSNLLKRTDARGVLTTYGYDTLNRLQSIAYTVTGTGVTATPSVNLTYGTNQAQFNNGRLITMTDGVGSENYTYNNLGQMTAFQKVINGTSYPLSYAYNLAGEMTSITYPSTRVVQQSFDAIGRLCAVGNSGSTCSSGTTFATGYAYNAAFQVTGLNYGNGVAAAIGYTPDRLLLQSLAYTKGATTLFSANYWYKTDSTNCPSGTSGNNGQIQCITDTVDSGRSASYSYDALYRLTAATTNGSTNYPKWGLSMTYDRYGNRLSQSQSFDAPPTNSVSVDAATNRITGSPYAYDANGNMTNDGNNTLVYDAENRLLSAINGGASGTYSYDGNSLRVKKVSGSTTTIYVFSGTKVIAEYSGTSAPYPLAREYIYSGGTLLAKIEASTTKYYHPDHLSNRVVTDSSGTAVAQLGHYPFGESWYNASSDKLLFTSYERDSESGNDYAMMRYSVNRLGRFSSPDPLPGSIGDPQSLDRYSYVRGDPGNLEDPLGLTGRHPEYAPSFDRAAFDGWLFEMFILASDPNSDLSIQAGERWNGEEWVPTDNPGSIFDPFGPPPPIDLNPPFGWPKDPPMPCQHEKNQNPATYNFVLNNYAEGSSLATLMGTTPANVLGVSSVESNNGNSNIATNYNNWFGLTYPFPGTGPAYNSPNGNRYSTYSPPAFWNSGISLSRSRIQGPKIAGTLTPQAFAGALTSPPMAFNSEPGRYQIYLNRINLVQADIDCLFGP
jgi:RHS repeat-associated protein